MDRIDVTPVSAEAMSATLHAPILRLLQAHPQGMKIHYLVTELSAQDGVALDIRNSDPLALFRVNFVVMNALFSLQRSLLQEGVGLEISTLMVRIYGRGGVATETALDTASNARLADYYLDWSHLEETSEDQVRSMLEQYWKRYWSHERAEEAYATLGLGVEAGKAEIKQAFRRLAAIHHPDKGGEAAQFLRIREAYENLS